MPPSAYLPDPGKWIKPGSTPAPSSKSGQPQQRVLTAKPNGASTPNTNPGSRARSSTTKENTPVPGSTAKQPLQKQQSLLGMGGFITPNPTPSGRSDRVKVAAVEGGKGRGSPVPRSVASQKGRTAARPLRSKLVVREDWKSEEDDDAKDEMSQKKRLASRPLKSKASAKDVLKSSSSDDDEIQIYDEPPPRAGPSKPRQPERPPPPRRTPSQPTPIPPSRKLSRFFSSGELTDLPPEYVNDPHIDDPNDTEGDESEDEIIHNPLTSPVLRRTPSPAPNRNPYAHLNNVRPVGTPEPEYPQPVYSPRILTQLPTQALAMHWRVNGLSTDQIGRGDVPWGKSAGWVENAARVKKRKEEEEERERERDRERERERERERAREREMERAQLIDQAKDMEESAEMAKGVVDNVLDNVAHKARDMRMSMVAEGTDDVKSRRIAGIRAAKRPPLSPIGLNTAKGIRRIAPPSPSPRKGKRKRTGNAHIQAAPVVDTTDEPDLGGGLVIRHQTPSPISSRHRRLPSQSPLVTPPRSDSLDELLDPIIEAAKRDALARDERTRLDHHIPPPVLANPIHCPSSSPEIVHQRNSAHHTITPPKKKRRMARDAEIRSLSPSPPRAPFSSTTRAGSKQFKPVEVEETLMTWSQGAAARDAERFESEGEVAGEDKQAGVEDAPMPASSPPAPVAAAITEETQSLPATEFTQSYPKFFESQTVGYPKGRAPPTKPPAPVPVPAASASASTSKWAALNQGILKSTPVAAAAPTAAAASSSKRKPRVSSGKATPKGKQGKLEMYGVVKEKTKKRTIREFEDDFEDEPEIEEEQAPDDPGPSRPRGSLGRVPDAPYHPELRPAGIRAAKAREERAAAEAAASRPQTRARTREADRSSPAPIPIAHAGPSRRAVSPIPRPSGSGPWSSSLLEDTTDEETQPQFRDFFEGLKRR